MNKTITKEYLDSLPIGSILKHEGSPNIIGSVFGKNFRKCDGRHGTPDLRSISKSKGKSNMIYVMKISND